MATIEALAPVGRWLPIEAAAAYLSLSPQTVRRLLKAGKLIAHRPSRGKILLDRLEIDAYVAGATKPLRSGRGMNSHGQKAPERKSVAQ